MAEYADRERGFNEGVGDVLGDFAVAAIEADSASKDANIARYIDLLERPNVDFKAETSIIGLDQKLETGISVPVIAVAPIEPLVVAEAEMKMSMTVSAHQDQTDKSDKSVASDTEVEGSGGGGIGPFRVKVRVKQGIKASMSTSSEKKRSSDYSATTDARILLKQGSPPEGLMKVIDALVSNTQKGLEINERLIEKQAQAMATTVDSMEALPEAAPA